MTNMTYNKVNKYCKITTWKTAWVHEAGLTTNGINKAESFFTTGDKVSIE